MAKINITSKLINDHYFRSYFNNRLGRYENFLAETEDGWVTNGVWAFRTNQLGTRLKSIQFMPIGTEVEKMLFEKGHARTVTLPVLPSKPGDHSGPKSLPIDGTYFNVDLLALLQFNKSGNSAMLWGKHQPIIVRADGNALLMGLSGPLPEFKD
jgi:hypothetical protein